MIQIFTRVAASATLLFLPFVASAESLKNPLGYGTFCGLLKGILNVLIALGLPAMVFFLVLAGARFVFARGNADKLKDARQNLLYTIIGIAMFLGVWVVAAVVTNMINSLQSSSGNSGGQISSSC
ncbi:MAG: protein of unknown function with transrane region [Candidatus Adlerbacteria bacterium]|nr:protein of unknown function with transrane region [Candidatus Adlerbacteria bacterium]